MEVKGNRAAIIRNRKIREKQERVQNDWMPRDNSWQRFARCKICKERYCCNNNEDHEVRPYRIKGVAICARCFFSKGTPQLVEMYLLIKDLANPEADSLSEVRALQTRAQEVLDG